jgi:predicted flap endonuclease-1-like 5' DNA nuclease
MQCVIITEESGSFTLGIGGPRKVESIIMLKKLFYIGLGISIIVAKKSVSYLAERKEWASEQVKHVKDADITTPPVTPEETDSSETSEGVTIGVKETSEMNGADDLTKIYGIGPTYAKRLKDAGVSTFVALSEMTPEELRNLTNAAGKSADTESWIIQARELI